MATQEASQQQLVDAMIQLAATLKAEDLQDPVNFALCSQLVQLLDGKAPPLPQELVSALSQIQDKAEQFRQAAAQTGASSPEELEMLVESMRASGLLKTQMDVDLFKTSPAGIDLSRSHILLYPVKIRGKSSSGVEGLPDHHVTVKWFGDTPKISHEQVHEVMRENNPAPPSNFEVRPHIFNSPRGPIHVLLLEGGDMSRIHKIHKEVQRHGDVDKFANYLPHITISKELHDEVSQKGLKAKDLGIEVGHLEYRIGDKVHQKFEPHAETTYPTQPSQAEQVREKITTLKDRVNAARKAG